MNRKEIRDAVFAQADWAPTQSADAVDRVNAFINRAYNQLVLDAPFLFFDSEVRFATMPDIVGSSTDTIQITDIIDDITPSPIRNAWVMQRTQSVGTPGYDAWKIDRSWDGRVIEIIETDGTIHRNRIRTIWAEERVQKGDSDQKYRLSLLQPWDIDRYGTGPFTYRIYSDLYYLSDDMIQLKSARLWQASYNWPLTVLGQDEAEQRSLADRRTEIAAGMPRAMFRRGHFQMPGPKVAPSVELYAEYGQQAELRWMGPEPPGKFDYVITYTWGKRDTDFKNVTIGQWEDNNSFDWKDDDNLSNQILNNLYGSSRDRFREPLWESAPSPVSASVQHASTGYSNGALPAIKITLPNIEYMQGFMLRGSGFERYNHDKSGWHVRIYRRRYTEDYTYYNNTASGIGNAGGDVVSSLRKLDLSEKYYLLAEVRIDSINGGVFTDNGSYLPDVHRPLRDIHGYQTLQLFPKPDERYEVDIRCIKRPQKLVDDTDVPRVHAEASDVLVHKTLMFLYEHQGNPSMAEFARVRYQENLEQLKKRYADLRPPQEPTIRRMSRARASLTGRGGIRRWYSTES